MGLGPLIFLRRTWLRWYVVKIEIPAPMFVPFSTTGTVLAGPLWRKRTAEVAMKLQEALHGR